MNRFWRTASVLAVLIAAAGLVSATPVSYSLLDLIQQNGTVQSGDKTFSNFAANITVFGTGTAVPGNLSGITVTPINSGGLFGLQLSGGMAAICATGTCPTTWDLNVSWDVSAATPYLIDGVYLSFNGQASPLGSSIAQVAETVNVGMNIVGSGNVTSPSPLSIFIPLDGAYPSIRITKDILLVANINEGVAFATVSDIDQYYRQLGVVVPEPGTYALIGAGLLGLGLLRRRLS